jgi:hypothetical protein
MSARHVLPTFPRAPASMPSGAGNGLSGYVISFRDIPGQVESILRRKYSETILDVVHQDMWDLDLANHLAGNKRTLLLLKFRNVKVCTSSNLATCTPRPARCSKREVA